jgi:hypothetical protein
LRQAGEEKNPYSLLEENFLDIFEKYNEDIFLHKDFEKDPFLNLIKNNENNETEKDKILNADDIFYFYLKEFYIETNKEYLHFMMKFVVMFRQCLNKIKDKESFSTPDPENYFTQKNNTEGLPDFCNEFIMDFMEPKEYFGMDVNELIEITQHLCHWLYSKQYTTSRLTLA